MSQGPSGRIVVEIDPERKRALYEALSEDGVTFKQWLLKNLEDYLAGHAHRAPFAPDRDSAGDGP